MIGCAILEAAKIRVDAPVEIPHDAPQQMINSLHIENFRCFQKLDLSDLGRFNIIVGNNSAGKTALLESIFLPSGRHDLVFRLRGHRGLMQAPLMPVKPVYEALWRDLFFRFSQTGIIMISLQGTPENLLQCQNRSTAPDWLCPKRRWNSDSKNRTIGNYSPHF